MTRFVVETYVPGERREDFDLAVERFREVGRGAATAAGVRHVRSFLIPGDEMGFHVLEAGSATAVRRAAVAIGIEPERVVEVVTVDAPPQEGQG